MIDSIRCPSCRGAKKVSKLGGIIGECNKCEGKGTILAADKPKSSEPVVEVMICKELINQVSDCVPASDIQHKASIETLPDVKTDNKKSIYKRKTAQSR